MVNSNRVCIAGVLIENSPIRYTPAGIPVAEAVIRHQSEQIEASINRQVECEVLIIALGNPANLISKVDVDSKLVVHGFLAAKSLRRRQDLVLHVEEFELLN